MARAPMIAALVLALPLTLLPAVLEPSGESTWWPAVGLVAALLLTVGRRAVPPVTLGVVAGMAAAIAVVYDIALALAAISTVSFVLPGLMAAMLLRRPAEAAPGPSLRGFATVRYHVVLLGASTLCAVLVGVLVVGFGDAGSAGWWLVTAFLGGLTSLLVLLPLVVPSSGRPASGRPGELWAQRAALVAVTLLMPLLGITLVLAFPLLGWAGLRAGRRETNLQLALYAAAVYVLSVAGLSPLDPAREVDVLPSAAVTAPLFLYLAALSYLMVPLAASVERLSQVSSDAVQTANTLERMLDGVSATMMVICDVEGRITHFNEGARQILGYEPEEVVGRTPHVFHSPDDIARLADELGVAPDLRAVTDEQARRRIRLDHHLICRDGTRKMVSLNVSEVRGPDGSVESYLACGEDVTERLRTQRALETALDHEHQSVLRLQEVDHVKQELVSNVSHELRTPITSIAGYAELLSDSSLGELTRPQRDALQRIERNALRLQSLVDDLLTLSRSEAGRLQLARQPLDLGELTRSAWELFDEQLRHRDLETTLAVSPQPVMVMGDRDALERVVVNLVSNAVKFTPDGGSVSVTVARGSDGSGLLVVRDSGIGIDANEQEKLFTRFFRSTQATDAAIQGTGLGLSIVQALVSQHGGQVGVRSRPGEGTRVTVELPSA